MVTLTSNIPELVLSSDLPDITLSCSDSSVTVSITVGSDILYDEELTPYNGQVKIYDVRGIISDYMLQHELNACDVMFTAFSTNTVHAASTVLLSRFKTELLIEDIDNVFLTTAKFLTMPRKDSAYVWLHFFNKNGNGTGVSVRANIKFYGDKFNMNFGLPAKQNNEPILIKYTDFTANMSEDEELISAVVTAGNRNIPIYFSDYLPTVSFLFMNAFGRQEVLHVFGNTDSKLNVNREIAECYDRSSFYDSSIENEFEVTTEPLTPNEAKQLQQLFASPRVALLNNNNTDWGEDWSDLEEVLITSSEVADTDSDESLVSAKFTWKFAKHQAKVKLY